VVGLNCTQRSRITVSYGLVGCIVVMVKMFRNSGWIRTQSNPP